MIPRFLQPFFWSYDISKIELQKHKKMIIAQVLNYGTKQATDWLFSVYPKEEIRNIANTIPQGQWDKKSLHLWTLVYNLHTHERFESVQSI